MATASLCTSRSLPELTFLRPCTTEKLRFSISITKINQSKPSFSLGARVKASKTEGSAVEAWEIDGIELNGNGSYGKYNGSVEKYKNGGVVPVIEGGNENGVAGNGSLVKYVNGSDNGAAAKFGGEVVGKKEGEGEKKKKKKSVEEIGQEDAWFKQKGQGQVEVSVAPGGRWNRFKTYSTIQRTLEIWGFVFTFIFRAWLDNQKFSYRGGIFHTQSVNNTSTLLLVLFIQKT